MYYLELGETFVTPMGKFRAHWEPHSVNFEGKEPHQGVLIVSPNFVKEIMSQVTYPVREKRWAQCKHVCVDVSICYIRPLFAPFRIL